MPRKIENEDLRKVQFTITLPYYLNRWIRTTKTHPGRFVEAALKTVYDAEKELENHNES